MGKRKSKFGQGLSSTLHRTIIIMMPDHVFKNACCPFHSVGHIYLIPRLTCSFCVVALGMMQGHIHTAVRDNLVNFEVFMLQLQGISFCTDLELTIPKQYEQHQAVEKVVCIVFSDLQV